MKLSVARGPARGDSWLTTMIWASRIGQKLKPNVLVLTRDFLRRKN
nr:MAG TPA: hypothetical protein [Bacteriophage sp.]